MQNTAEVLKQAFKNISPNDFNNIMKHIYKCLEENNHHPSYSLRSPTYDFNIIR